MIKNQKGFTTLELLIASVILLTVVVAAFKFFETYDIRAAELGEYETAKMLAINGIESERKQIKEGDDSLGLVYRNEMTVNTVSFGTNVTKKTVTSDFSFFNTSVPMYHLTAIVRWKEREMEVSTYVSAQ